MPKIMSLDQLEKLRKTVKDKVDLREKGENVEKMIVIRVAMATCGMASGAKEILSYLADLIKEKGIENVVLMQSDCMGYCDVEPTIEVTFPGKEPVLYGNVDQIRAREIVEKHILGNHIAEGSLPARYKSLDD